MPRILVADDNTNIQKMVVLAFQERGIEVITVGNGEAAVRRIPDANPDLVLADVFMPVRNGYEVCEFVKKDPRFSHIPVILLVGAFDPLDEKEARRVGADGVLKKPFVPPDPLIAMVMSALEKNPKVVAELAKAKEAKEVAAATPLPAAAMENPAMAEPKPLPEFPEPSPEEAAMIYGFGKGVRAIDSEDTEEDEEPAQTKKSKSPQTLKDPQESQKKSKTPAVVAPKTPVVAMEEEDEESFDSSATASDWRRNAADFEVPDNVEANPIYSYGKNFEPITFPSERDVPPKHVRPNDESQDAVSEQSSSPAAPTVVSSTGAATQAEATIPDPPASWELPAEQDSETEQAASSTVTAESAVASASAEEISSPAAGIAASNVQETVHGTAAPENSPERAVQNSQEVDRPGFVARIRGWMDMMSPSSDESSETTVESGDQHWMTSLASPSATSTEAVVAQSSEPSASLHGPEGENPVKLAEVESLAENAASPVVVENTATTRSESPIGEVRAEASREETSHIRADEPLSSTELAAKSDVPSQESTHQEIRASAAENVWPQVCVETPSEPSHENTRGTWSDLLASSDDERRQSDTVADHPPLEPIISDLREQPSASEDEPEQEPAHVAEWLRHREDQTNLRAEESLPAESVQAELAGDSWSQHHNDEASHEKPFADQPEPSLFDREPSHAFTESFAERIPTLPPPNREALSQIPFLMPHSEREPSVSEGLNASNSAAVDEVVRRVLEKLQPQLHELLSQGVKPLVENMLQNELKSELHKNEK